MIVIFAQIFYRFFSKFKDAYCLAVYLGTGNIVVYSLPSLRILIDQDFLPLTDVRYAN